MRIRISHFWEFFILFILFILCSTTLHASPDIQTLFVKANAAYAQNDLVHAQEYYLEILHHSFCSDILFYNLGNTYLLQGKIGEAVYYYEQAKKWTPRNPELEENYRLARKGLALPAKELPAFFQFILYWHLKTSINEELFLTLVCFLAFLFTLYLRGSPRFQESTFSTLPLIFAFCWILTASGSAYKIYQEVYQERGVLLQTATKVYVGPNSTGERVQALAQGSKTDLLLPAGLLFQIENKSVHDQEEWWQVRFENEVRGWILATTGKKL
jgi:tetratricopeptide (TPR) repeat protein